MEKRIFEAFNAPGAFSGQIANSANIGKASQEIAELWNQAHPEDPIGSGG